jgi:peptidylprolyl isomerase
VRFKYQKKARIRPKNENATFAETILIIKHINMFRKLLLLAIIGLQTVQVNAQKTSPAKSDGYTTTASGLQYKITQKTGGAKPQPGDKVTVHYTGKLTNDTVFDSSVSRGQPFQFKLGRGQVIKGWDEGIALLGKGEKATLVIPANLGYGERAMGKIPSNSTLIFDVELIDFEAGFKPQPYDVKGKDTIRTNSGLGIIMVKTNEQGVKPTNGNMVSVHYTGYLTDGSMFDSSVERGQPFQFGLGKGQVIKGWDEGIAALKEGEKARLVVPYTLGYGENGFPPVIPAKATLIFDVELIKAN